MCGNSEGSGETGRMHRLAWAFAGRLCDKYQNLMSWLNFLFPESCYTCTGDSISKCRGSDKIREILVVWDRQSMTSFTFFMYVELLTACKKAVQNCWTWNVTDGTLFIIHSKKTACDQYLFCKPLPQFYLWYTLISFTQFLQHVGNVCCLHQRKPLNSVHPNTAKLWADSVF